MSKVITVNLKLISIVIKFNMICLPYKSQISRIVLWNIFTSNFNVNKFFYKFRKILDCGDFFVIKIPATASAGPGVCGRQRA